MLLEQEMDARERSAENDAERVEQIRPAEWREGRRDEKEPIPGSQTEICPDGVALGPRAGMSVGGLAALISNFYLGQGAYTPWQMLAWAGCGLLGGLAAPLLRHRVPLALTCFALGFAFDAVMDVWEWLSFYPHTWQAFTALYVRGIWFDVAHASGNLVLALVVGPELRRLLERYARRLKAEVVWA